MKHGCALLFTHLLPTVMTSFFGTSFNVNIDSNAIVLYCCYC
jgi:hypothetical protein